MESEQELLRETYRLAKENNQMLRAMRRNAFLGGLFKLAFYVVIFIVIPVWLYVQYVGPALNQALDTLNQIQTAGNQAQTQMSDWQKALQGIQAKIPGMSSTSGQ